MLSAGFHIGDIFVYPALIDQCMVAGDCPEILGTAVFKLDHGFALNSTDELLHNIVRDGCFYLRM